MKFLRIPAIPMMVLLSLLAGSAVAMGATTSTTAAAACPSPTVIAGTSVKLTPGASTAVATEQATTASTEAATEKATEASTEAATEQATQGATETATKAACPTTVAKIAVGDFFFKPNVFTLPANTKVTFEFTNGGSLEHYFVIDSQKVKVELKPGKTVTTTLELPTGTYVFYCSVPGHKQLGMVGQLTVK